MDAVAAVAICLALIVGVMASLLPGLSAWMTLYVWATEIVILGCIETLRRQARHE